MKSSTKTKKLRVGGMTCVSCQNKIQKKLENTAGIHSAEVSYNDGTAIVTYDTDIISLEDICSIITKLDYEVLSGDNKPQESHHTMGILVIIFALYTILEHWGILNLLSPGRLAETNMGYGMLFLIGIMTSVHCIAMCGGINLSQCIPKGKPDENGSSTLSALRPAFLYNAGRVISYTVTGFIVGALGSVITFSNFAQGILKLAAGFFMVIMGINMLGIFPWLRRFNPRMPKIFAKRIGQEKAGNKSPLIIGILNGLMPCGPLQAMQIYALSTGNPLEGALSMFLFSLGTVPLMFGLGALSSVLSKRFSKKVMTAGAVLVAILGLSMLSQGWSLAGFESGPSVTGNSGGFEAVQEDGVQIINSTLVPGRYPAITVQAGVPVKWIINAPQGSINGCNNRMFIKEYNIEHQFKPGENIIEFMPEKTGTFRYSCWMGMIRSTITVVDQKDADTDTSAQNSDSGYESGALITPVPADYVIPTEELAIATVISEGGEDYQRITMELTDEGFSPAAAVIQAGVDTQWVIKNSSSSDPNSTLLIPSYYKELVLAPDENILYLFPTESFDFSNGDNTFYGYIKVVEDIDSIDEDAIKSEIKDYQTLVWPIDTFQMNGGGSCCQ